MINVRMGIQERQHVKFMFTNEFSKLPFFMPFVAPGIDDHTIIEIISENICILLKPIEGELIYPDHSSKLVFHSNIGNQLVSFLTSTLIFVKILIL